MTTLKDAARAVKKTMGAKQDKIEWQAAMLGDGHGNVVSTNNMVYCRLASNSSVIEVLNLRCAPIDGLRVRIAKTPEMPLVWQVIGQADQRADENGDGAGGGVIYNTPLHGILHGYLGIDQVNVDWRQITNLRVKAVSGFTIKVVAGLLPRPGADLVVPSQTLDLTSHIPGAGLALWVLIYIDTTGALATLDGATKAGLLGLTLADIPDTPAGGFRLAAVRLYAGQTAIIESTGANDIRDLRWPQEKLAGVMAFTELSDVPHTYAGAGGKVIAVNSGETGLEFITESGGELPAYSEVNVSNPPTESDIISCFGMPADVDPGFTGLVNDNAAESNVYLAAATPLGWWIVPFAKTALLVTVLAVMLVTDTYTDTPGVHLNAHTPDSGGAWTENSGSWTIQAGGDVRNTTAAGAYYIATQDIGKAGASIRVKAGTVAASGDQFAGVILRYSDASNFWLVGYITSAGSPVVVIRKIVAGVYTDVVSKVWTNRYQKWITIEATANGNVISAVIDGGFGMTVTDTFNNTATKFGIAEYRDGTYLQNGFDDFQIVDLPAYAWTRQGTIFSATETWEQSTVMEPNVIYEGNPQILTAAHVFKMWYSGGWVASALGYAESTDGVTWTKYASNPILTDAQHTCVIKVDGVYYLYSNKQSSGNAQIDLYTSTDGIHFTLDTASVLAIGGVGTWDHGAVGNCRVWREATNQWKMLYDAAASGGVVVYRVGLATSTDGRTWTKSGSNPVTPIDHLVGRPWVRKYSDGYYYIFAHVSPDVFVPDSIVRFRSTDLITWTQYPEFTIMPRVGAGEGEDTYIGQASEVFIVETGGTAYMFFAGTSDGLNSTGNFHMELATANAAAIRGY